MKRLFWGGAPIRNNEAEVRGDLVRRDGEKYYRIGNYDQMPPFFISVVSGFDHLTTFGLAEASPYAVALSDRNCVVKTIGLDRTLTTDFLGTCFAFGAFMAPFA